jgi:DNA-binding SARP family transcriptional activator/tetratricopeptide (TPR) repeat protein
MRFVVLGPVRAWRDRDELDLGPPLQRAMLALLLVRAGETVPPHEIIDVLWGESAPSTALNMVQRYAGGLRRLLGAETLPRVPGGYRLSVEPSAVDLLCFRRLCAQARERKSAEPLLEALGLWRGSVADGLSPELRSRAVFSSVEAELVAAATAAAGYATRAAPGVVDRVLTEVRRVAARHPLDELLQARLMTLLAVGGRQAEALETFQAVRAELADQLGVEPGPELRAAHQRVLSRQTSPAGDEVRPAQLPADLAIFAGRGHELEQVESPEADVVTISGMGGVGKTTLAVRWAHRAAARYPDGQLYLDLHGFHPGDVATTPYDALGQLLEALGTPARRVPGSLRVRAAMFRERLAGRRVLVVLDNARDGDQVLPLLPRTPGCLTLVTSRDRLTELNVRAVTLDPLPACEAADLLRRRLGAQRVDAEPEAVAELVEHAGRLPLALAMVASRAAVNPGFPLAAIAEELRESRGSLEAFAGEGPHTDVRSVFAWSYRILSPGAARLFRLFPVHPGPECPPEVAAALAGAPGVERELAELLRAHLISEPSPGRYAAHDLLRAYATELADDREADEARERLLDHLLHSASAAIEVMFPARERLAIGAPAEGAAPRRFPDPAAAAAWFDREHEVMVSVTGRSVGAVDRQRWQLAAMLEPYLDRTGRYSEQREAQTCALRAAGRLGDAYAMGCAEMNLGFAEVRAGRRGEGERHLRRALRHLDAAGDLNGKARVHRLIAFALNQRERFEESLASYELAAGIYRRTGLRSGSAAVGNEIGWTYILMGESERALPECRAAIALYREIGHRSGEAGTWDSLGYAQHRLGDHDAARDSFGHAVRLYRELADRGMEADTLVHSGDSELAAGNSAEAARDWRAALRIFDELGHPEAAAVREKVHELGVRSMSE